MLDQTGNCRAKEGIERAREREKESESERKKERRAERNTVHAKMYAIVMRESDERDIERTKKPVAN